MPKEFYTEKDIEDLVKRGVMSLDTNDNVVLTDLAYEKANRLGVRLVRDKPDNPPGAPVRPYLSQGQKPAPAPQPPRTAEPSRPAGLPAMPAQPAASRPAEADLHNRIRQAVIARMGSQIDPALLDTIIKRVLASTGVK